PLGVGGRYFQVPSSPHWGHRYAGSPARCGPRLISTCAPQLGHWIFRDPEIKTAGLWPRTSAVINDHRTFRDIQTRPIKTTVRIITGMYGAIYVVSKAVSSILGRFKISVTAGRRVSVQRVLC